MKETWNPAEISEDIKPVNYVNADSWNAAELNEAINLFGIKYPVDTWNPAELDEKARNIINDITSTKTITGNPISFKTINGGYAKSCEVTFSPIQSGSGDPSPENVRPISGWDSLVLGQSGKNLSSVNSVSDVAWAAANANLKTIFNSLKNGTYTISFDITVKTVTSTGDWVYGFIAQNPNGNVSKMTTVTTDATVGYNGSITYTFTITDSNRGAFTSVNLYGCGTWTVGRKGTADFSNIQIEIGNQKTDYSAYQGTTHTATLGSTYYGGSLELVSGKLTSEWGYIASYDGETITEPWISSIDVYAPNTSPSTGAEVCYKLATPQEITLKPETIALLKGNNVLWIDGDSIELKYTKLALPDDSDGLSINQKVRKAIEIMKGKAINEELKKEETKKSVTKGRRKKS